MWLVVVRRHCDFLPTCDQHTDECAPFHVDIVKRLIMFKSTDFSLSPDLELTCLEFTHARTLLDSLAFRNFSTIYRALQGRKRNKDAENA